MLQIPTLTDIFLCFYHLSTHSHLARPPQQVFSMVEELQIDQASVAVGLCGIRTVELRHAALQGLHETSFNVGVAQDVVGGHQALSGVVETGPSNALRRGGDFTVLVYITRVLWPQNKSDGRDGSSRHLSNPAPLFSASLTSRDKNVIVNKNII